MSNISIIIQREFNERVRKKSFIITTLLMPVLMIGLMAAPALIMQFSRGDEKVIAVIDDSGLVAPKLENDEEIRFETTELPTEEARKQLGIEDNRPLLLSYWGSLGAEVMNRQMVDFIAKECYEGAPFRHIHGAGRDFSWMQEELLRRGLKLGDNGVEVREYIYDMPLVMAAADVVLCRAGASTISELTAIAKPAILVPSPNVTANHQEKNARVLADQGAAVLLLEKDCQRDELYEQAEALLRDRPRRDGMIRALTSMAVPDAGEKIYITLRSLMRG